MAKKKYSSKTGTGKDTRSRSKLKSDFKDENRRALDYARSKGRGGSGQAARAARTLAGGTASRVKRGMKEAGLKDGGSARRGTKKVSRKR